MPATNNMPNIVFILIDDLGWMDVGCQGSRSYLTPNIDHLADEGMRFTDAYAACTVCSPTRASIMTGKYPARLNLTDWISGHEHPWAKLRVPDWTQYLPHDETALARAFSNAGYNTFFTGKWHLGGRQYYPDKHGFDVNIGGCHRGLPPSYFSPYGIETLEDGPEGEYLTDRLTDEAIRMMEKSGDEPFFLYLSHYAVHTPLEAKEEIVQKYLEKDANKHLNEVYAAMIESTDRSVGRVLHKLEDMELAEDTIVVFFSDNGGLTRVTSNAPLRHGKGSPYEGGHRVPLIIRWPGHADAGSTCQEPVISNDFYPTLLEACGLPPMPRQHCDGRSLVPLLKGEERLHREALYWHYPHYHFSTPYAAVRSGDYKLIEYFEGRRVELYNLADDIGESNDLAEAE
ncbi:MAG: sulfatase, partial [Planctomycetota bacterium]